MLTNEYLKRVYDGLAKRNANEPEFLQAVREVLESIQPVVEKHPEYEKAALIERLVEPERIISFRVPWVFIFRFVKRVQLFICFFETFSAFSLL